MDRRTLLVGTFAAIGLAAVRSSPAATGQAVDLERLRSSWRNLLAPGAKVASADEKLELTDDAWRSRLTAAQYRVLREADTERPGSSPLNHEKRPGIFLCAGCDLPVFSSAMKFDSGTGWPSFFTTIPGAFQTKLDFSLVIPRTEYHCARCGGHHGHVFDDGPPPTHQRWCNNGVALRFLPHEV